MDVLKAAQFPKFSVDMQLFFQVRADLLVLVTEYFCGITVTVSEIIYSMATKLI